MIWGPQLYVFEQLNTRLAEWKLIGNMLAVKPHGAVRACVRACVRVCVCVCVIRVVTTKYVSGKGSQTEHNSSSFLKKADVWKKKSQDRRR